jgi:hypothetical protein
VADRSNRAEIIPAAVADKSGMMDFYMEASAGETSSLIRQHSNAQAKRVSVQVVTLDADLERRKIKFVDCLKIDAEGYDVHVLKGAENCLARKMIGIIQFEYNAPWAFSSSSTLIAALEYLKGCDYRVYLLKHNGLYNFDYDVYGEFFHYANFVAIAPGFLEVRPLSLL